VVLGDDRDGATGDLWVVDLAGADVELGGDLDALRLQRQGVDLREYLVLGEVGRADDDGAGRPAGEGVAAGGGATAGGRAGARAAGRAVRRAPGTAAAA